MKKFIGFLSTVWSWIKKNFSIKGTKVLKIAAFTFCLALSGIYIVVLGIIRVEDPVYILKEMRNDSQVNQLLSTIQKYKSENRQLRKDIIDKNDIIVEAYKVIKEKDEHYAAIQAEVQREALLISKLRVQADNLRVKVNLMSKKIDVISTSLRSVQDASNLLQKNLNTKTQELLKSQNVVNSSESMGWILGFMMAGLK